ncbi:MAG: hypothetical protein JHC33_14225 [Ignisphaera sp.]|nr:hypothetical protein [Ignisphaera sp.]
MTLHFTFDELTNSRKYPNLVPQNRLDAQKYISSGDKLADLLEQVRDLFGGMAITVDSGFRNPSLNTAVGSKAKSSAHLRFEAADIVPTNMSVANAFKLLVNNKDKLPNMRKAIIEMGWIHIEVKTAASQTQTLYTTSDGVNFKEVV